MSMKTLYDLKDMLCGELDEIGKKGEMSAGDLETVHKLTDTIKNIDKITMLEENGYSRDEDYSRDGDWSANMRGNYGRGSSYARRGSHYVRGHYSRDDERDSLMRKLEEMMRSTDGYDRETIQRCIDELKNA
uniref:Uncharacterized protein n=1 Tax=Siphoviridae sp. ct2hZ16 TaxID=2826276 RepID=A0A8S5QUE6_9CAUD|nr:MAG TPA: hypothetical protein [Siphoviridae sp. ct2hZ16]